jgi:DNA-binding MarR family transcriptional regulator
MSKPQHLRDLHAALFDLVGMLNRPQPDLALLGAAGVSLERALFPLLVRIGREGPIGVVELSELVGRDHSTVSRQVARLEALGLVERRPGAQDRRVREAVPSEEGRFLLARIDMARGALFTEAFKTWSDEDLETLSRLLRRFADQALQWARD